MREHFIPVSPEAIPPQYTVQFFGLDWFTTSSNLNCFVLSIKREGWFSAVGWQQPRHLPRTQASISHLTNTFNILGQTSSASIMLIPNIQKKYNQDLEGKLICDLNDMILAYVLYPHWTVKRTNKTQHDMKLLLSCVLLGAGGFLVAQLVLIWRPPNHWPPMCTIAFSASWRD